VETIPANVQASKSRETTAIEYYVPRTC